MKMFFPAHGNESNLKGFEDDIELEGSAYALGEFSIEVTKGPETNRHPVFSHPSKTHFDNSIYAALPVPQEQMWLAKGLFLWSESDE
jgi:mannosyl-oligosaccharide glucosidase